MSKRQGSPVPGILSSSVVVCTYNGERFLGAQLDSLLAQSCRPGEILIYDDASTDASVDIARDFIDRAQRAGIDARLMVQPANIGFVANFSAALAAASGEVVLPCDQDDIWYPDKLATLLPMFATRPSLSLVFTNARLVDARGDTLGHTLFDALVLSPAEIASIHRGDAFDVLVRRSAATGATVALRRTLLDQVLPIAMGWIHDEWLAIGAAAIGEVDLVERPLIDYRQHGGNQVGMRKRRMRDRWLDMFRPCEPLLRGELARMDALDAWLAGHPAPGLDGRRGAVDARHRHYLARLALGGHPRLQRWPAVIGEWSHGDYGRYSNGFRSVLRDVLRRG